MGAASSQWFIPSVALDPKPAIVEARAIGKKKWDGDRRWKKQKPRAENAIDDSFPIHLPFSGPQL